MRTQARQLRADHMQFLNYSAYLSSHELQIENQLLNIR